MANANKPAADNPAKPEKKPAKPALTVPPTMGPANNSTAISTIVAMVLGAILLVLVGTYAYQRFNKTAKPEAPIVGIEDGKVFVPPPRTKTAAELEIENQMLRQQMEMANSGRKAAEENQLPDGVKVTHMESRSLKKVPWKFLKWDRQGNYVFPLIANDNG